VLCLKCHGQPAPKVPPTWPGLATTGVGCESCHGPAGGWLVEHSRPEWQAKKLTPAQKKALGLVVLDTATARAQQCVTCHVGDAGQEVNHDLIAAGHPRLNFEMAAFLAEMPKHWDVADVNAKHPPISQSLTWLAGQAVTARASLALTRARAANPEAPWPEFSEYGCFACHHALRDQGMQFGRPGRRPGALPWGTWAFALTGDLASQGGADAPKLTAALDEIDRLMAAPLPDRDAVADRAAAAIVLLDPWIGNLEAKGFNKPALLALMARWKGGPGRRPDSHWDAATQLYLVLAVLQGLLGEDDRPLGKSIDALHGVLMFTPGYDSPGPEYDPGQVREAVNAILPSVPAP
jgi:hypothetical protein